MSWTSILALAGGADLCKAIGFLILGPAIGRSDQSTSEAAPRGVDRVTTTQTGWPVRLGQLLPPALLAALVVSQTVVTGTELVVDARLAGVSAGAVAVWRGAPFWLVLVIAAAGAAVLRLVAT